MIRGDILRRLAVSQLLLRGHIETVMSVRSVDAEGLAEVLGREHAGGRLDHSIEVYGGQRHAFVKDGSDLKTTLEQFGEKLLAGDGIVGQVVMRMRVALEGNRVFDFVFCEHGDVGLRFNGRDPARAICRASRGFYGNPRCTRSGDSAVRLLPNAGPILSVPFVLLQPGCPVSSAASLKLPRRLSEGFGSNALAGLLQFPAPFFHKSQHPVDRRAAISWHRHFPQ